MNKLARELVKIAGLVASYTISDEDKAQYKKETEWYYEQLKKRGFDSDPKFVPQFTLTVGKGDDTFSLATGLVSYPESSMIANNPWFATGVVKFDGEGNRGGVVKGRFGFKCKKVKQLHKILVQTLEEIDKWIKGA